MTGPDFDKLKPTPAPRPAARRAALDAAMAAFDAHNAEPEQDAQESDTTPQGNVEPLRLSERSHQTKGRSTMSNIHAPHTTSRAFKARYMIAASLVVLAATPVVLRVMNERESQTSSSLVADVVGDKGHQAPPPPEAATPPRTSSAQVGAPVAAQRGQESDVRLSAEKKDGPGARERSNVVAVGKVADALMPHKAEAPRPYPSSVAPPMMRSDHMVAQPREFRDKFDHTEQNAIKAVAEEPVSTFSIDVDTASYSFARRALMAGHLPPKESVRVEEMINYFPYAYPAPDKADPPFRPSVTITPSPWAQGNQLVHVAIKGYELRSAERPRANLVFLIDVSGSMTPADRLPLVKNAFRMLVDELQPTDTVAIVTYAAGSGVALPPTTIADKAKIIAAIDSLGAGGSTSGAQGIQDAYRLAEDHFDRKGVNRIILATDGDFNVGVTNQNELKGLIERKREKGIYLSILGVGQDNYNDALMQTLAQNGNGIAAYADTLNEARKVMVDQASAMLFPIANDVKIQMEWNPARVSEYRLIGYETRALKREDFNNDKVDAGDIGSGHTITAIYEITPAGAPAKAVDELRYGGKPAARADRTEPTDKAGEIGFLKMRYKLPGESVSKLLQTPLNDALVKKEIAQAPDDVRFSIAVAGYGQLLTGGRYLKAFGYDDVLALASGARGDDRFGYRAEFLNLVRLAKSARP